MIVRILPAQQSHAGGQHRDWLTRNWRTSCLVRQALQKGMTQATEQQILVVGKHQDDIRAMDAGGAWLSCAASACPSSRQDHT